MATTYDKASLVMLPSGYKDDKLYSIKPTNGSGDFTFSRDGAGASPATRVNASGLIEKGRTNEILQSNQFDTTWAAGGTLTSGQSGYDGTSDAWLFTYTSAANIVNQANTFSGVQTLSVYAKGSVSNGLRLYAFGTSNCYAYYDLNIGAVESTQNIIDAQIEDKGNGWYRCIMTFNQTNSNIYMYLTGNNNSNAGSGSILIQDAQLEQGLISTSYIETTTAPVSAGLLGDMPRLDYSGGASCPSLLLEPSRVNIVEYAEYFDIYTKSNATITNNSDQSPEGLQNASSLVGNGATSSHYIFRNSGTAVSGTDYTISFFAKSGSLDYVQLVMGSGAFGVMHQNFDLSNGTIGSSSGSVTPFIESYANNWYRVGVTITATASTTITPFIALANSSTMSRLASFATSDDVKIYGLQVESGSYPTSYIPTYGSASTRGVDDCSKTGISSLLNDSEGTLFLEMQGISDGGDSRRFTISDGSIDNRVSLEYDENAGRIKAFMSTGGTTTGALDESGHPQTENHKIALTYTASAFKIFIDGVLEGEDTSLIGTPVGLDEIEFGSGSGNNPMEGLVKQALVFPTALTDAECIALTTI